MRNPALNKVPGLDQRITQAFRGELLAWFSAHRRVLPWRQNRTPYRVWISELMLQQTRVDQAIPYYRRFLKRFPGLRSLAAAPRADVLKLWEGLGYYSRAVRAQETARYLVEQKGGRFPRTLDGLRALPGIGPYTAAAVGSLAMGLDAAVVDGNVIRVLSRVMAFGHDARRPDSRALFQEWATALMPPGQAGEFNEAVMELGAILCTPRQPTCPKCPLRSVCRARQEGRMESYPASKPKAKIPHKHVGAALVVNERGQLLIAQRHEKSMLGGLWEFPGGKQEPGESMPACIARELREELSIDVAVGEHAVTVAHAFSHFTMDLHVHWARIRNGRPRAVECAAFCWVSTEQLKDFAFGRADQKVMEAMAAEGWPGLRHPAVPGKPKRAKSSLPQSRAKQP